jgi:hypothetical protein
LRLRCLNHATTVVVAEAKPAEAAAETKNSIVEVGNSMLNATVQAVTPRGLFSSGAAIAPADALSSAPTVQAAAKQTIPETPAEVGLPTLKPESAAASHLAPPPARRYPMGPTRPDALENGDDTNLDDFDDDDDAIRPFGACCRPSRRKRHPKRKHVGIDPEVKRELSALDSDLAEVLGRGDIALVSAKWLKAQLARQPDYRIVRRQDLKPVGGIKPHLTPKEAKRLLLEGRRAVGAFSLGWPTQGNPDPTGHRIQAFWHALQERPDIEAFFWDYPSLYQNSDHSPRTAEQERAFKRGLRVVRRSRSERSSGTPHVMPPSSLHAVLCTTSLRECRPPPSASAPCVRLRRR